MDGIVLARLVDEMTLKIEREDGKRAGAVSIYSFPLHLGSLRVWYCIADKANSSNPQPEAQAHLPTAASTLHATLLCISKPPKLALIAKSA